MFQTTSFCFSLMEILLNFVKVLIFLGYSDMLNKLAAIVSSLCFKRQILELLMHLSFKAELPTNGL